MSQILRSYTFTDGTNAYGSEVESEIANIVNTFNNHDSGASQWTALKTSGDLTVAGNFLLSGYIPSTNRLLFKGLNGTSIAQIGYLLNQMMIMGDNASGGGVTIRGDGTNDTMLMGNPGTNLGANVTRIFNAQTEPTAGPASGGILYAYGGTLYWYSSGGNKRTVAAV